MGSLATAAVLVFVLAGHRDEFADALSSASLWVLAVAVLLQIVALLARSEAWHLTIEAAGGTVARRVLYRASSMQVLGGLINGHLGVAARIAALRRSSPDVSPQVPTLIAAEFPILAVEATLAALTSFTLVGAARPAVVAAADRPRGRRGAERRPAAPRRLRRPASCGRASRCSASCGAAAAWSGSCWWPCSRRSSATGSLLHAVGVDASFFDAIAVLIAVGDARPSFRSARASAPRPRC